MAMPHAKDLGDLEFALGLGVDYVALSFVREAKDLLCSSAGLPMIQANV